MITFETIRLKNFLSFGNTPFELSLNASPFTLIVGENGTGKTSLPVAISFALYGKTQRAIKKNQYINSINQRDCLVELEFRRSTDPQVLYTIRRGLKPNIFEIYKNNVLINQDSNVRDYQKYLEQEILGFNYTVFNQIVFLSSHSYTPFMMLSAGQRREVIEEILSIDIFSKIKIVLKQKLEESRNRLNELSESCAKLKYKLKSHRDYMSVLEEQNSIDRKRILDDIHNKTSEQLDIQTQIKTLQSSIQELESILTGESEDTGSPMDPASITVHNLSKKENDLRRNFANCENSLTTIRKQLAFFSQTDQCPTCSQPIDSFVKEKNEKILRNEQKNVESSIDILEKVQRLFDEKHRIFSTAQKEIADQTSKIFQLQFEYSTLDKEKNRLSEQLASIDRLSSIDEYREKERELAEIYETFQEHRNVEHDWQLNYLNRLNELLKDTGIKAQMIRQYIPLINQLLNAYLSKLNFFVSFHFDENFNETILSRHRDNFSYGSFSAGQQARIDLALLFVWREIAKKRNSASCNLLFLDEVFESSIDRAGIDDLVDILTENSENCQENVYIITHSDEIKGGEMFTRRLEVTKPKNFTEIRQVVDLID